MNKYRGLDGKTKVVSLRYVEGRVIDNSNLFPFCVAPVDAERSTIIHFETESYLENKEINVN